ncbi:SDR family NAD(P)-dependent oxidoreductase [Sphingomonas baiyangensis]|uniref:SDR family oxidoreductase n=1 Tax=Sphingomonas baiyangensis TaxID=2572576 RepID=A0A4U1L8H5_9SPHN|nr:SDR family oxidoreductase [Sphingomonas baiyangensis]TKD53277.1 SDR family oxidoreductase [Sphingomonas baiyangensis]
MDFTRRTALVTGAASGIGLATARLLAGAGARIVAIDLNRDALAAALPEAMCHVGDVADPNFWANLVLPPLDHVVVNAGVAGAAPIVTMDFAEWRRILGVNLDGAFLTLAAGLRALRDGGSIVAVASAAGIKAEPGIAAYGASKAGLLQLMRVAAKESASRRIRVNAIAPAGVETPVWDAVPMFADRAAAIGRDAAFAELAALATPLGRYATADEVARQIAFLLGDEAALVTGSVLVSDGGYLL